MRIMQGDQYALTFRGQQHGAPLDMETVLEVEFQVGRLRKTWPGEVTQDAEGNFLFPLTQAETFAITRAAQHVQVRVKFAGDPPTVIGADCGTLAMAESISRVVL